MNSLEAKLVVLGSSGVGKTSLVLQFVEKRFSLNPQSTQGAMFITKKLMVDANQVKLQLWDTAGQERFKSLNPLYYREARAAILVFDLSSQESFESLSEWHSQLMQYVTPDIVLVLCGNKVDLPRSVDEVVARKFAKQLGAIYLETSAKDNVGVEEMFISVGKSLLSLDDAKLRPRERMLQSSPGRDQSGCC